TTMEEQASVDESVVWKNADVSDNVVTIQELHNRRQALLKKRNHILDQMRADTNIENSIADCDTLTTVLEPVPSTSGLPKVATDSVLDFSSDDSVLDPDYVPLSQITNVQPFESLDHIEWFPERDTEAEVGRLSRSRKRKADRLTWKREHNRKNRMLGKEYLGYKKNDNKYPEKTMGPLCNSQFCARSKVFFCSHLTQEMRLSIFNKFWCMSWSEKKMFVSSMVDKTETQRKTIGTDSRRSSTKAYYFQIEGKKERVCLITFINTLGIKQWTVRYWLGDRGNKEKQINVSMSALVNTESKRDSIKSYLSVLPKLPSHYCRKSNDFTPLPRRPRNALTLTNSVPLLFSSRVPILESKYLHLQQLKSVIPADCHQYYDNLPYLKKK
ncbi:hypothetical protein HW555_008143, partial [Spodoptera exigua]